MLRSTLTAALVLLLAGAGCASSEPNPPPPKAVAVDGTVRLAVGEAAALDGHTVRFAEVVEDSRCPRGVQCITAGQARIRVEVDRQSVELTVPGGQMAEGAPSSAEVGGLAVTVTALEPYPEVGQDGAQAKVARLTLAPS